eukprot:m.348593 g.348593  ORF g.348593 m.348593 type:complete len:3373 (+) comp16563_c0_seq1:252-10370(+)
MTNPQSALARSLQLLWLVAPLVVHLVSRTNANHVLPEADGTWTNTSGVNCMEEIPWQGAANYSTVEETNANAIPHVRVVERIPMTWGIDCRTAPVYNARPNEGGSLDVGNGHEVYCEYARSFEATCPPNYTEITSSLLCDHALSLLQSNCDSTGVPDANFLSGRFMARPPGGSTVNGVRADYFLAGLQFLPSGGSTAANMPRGFPNTCQMLAHWNGCLQATNTGDVNNYTFVFNTNSSAQITTGEMRAGISASDFYDIGANCTDANPVPYYSKVCERIGDTLAPVLPPTVQPTPQPSALPSVAPSITLTASPTVTVTDVPSDAPTTRPSLAPTRSGCTATVSGQTTFLEDPVVCGAFILANPSPAPDGRPAACFETNPATARPVFETCPGICLQCTSSPSAAPTRVPTAQPTFVPTQRPTSLCNGVADPSTCNSIDDINAFCSQVEGVQLCPARCQSVRGVGCPTQPPTPTPTSHPTTLNPTSPPTFIPSSVPTREPTLRPSGAPTVSPTARPTTCFVLSSNGSVSFVSCCVGDATTFSSALGGSCPNYAFDPARIGQTQNHDFCASDTDQSEPFFRANQVCHQCGICGDPRNPFTDAPTFQPSAAPTLSPTLPVMVVVLQFTTAGIIPSEADTSFTDDVVAGILARMSGQAAASDVLRNGITIQPLNPRNVNGQSLNAFSVTVRFLQSVVTASDAESLRSAVSLNSPLVIIANNVVYTSTTINTPFGDSHSPTGHPTASPTMPPTGVPTTDTPTTLSPTSAPTLRPTHEPSVTPTAAPTEAPTVAPSDTLPPSTLSPTPPPLCNGVADPAECTDGRVNFPSDCVLGSPNAAFARSVCPANCGTCSPPPTPTIVILTCEGVPDPPVCHVNPVNCSVSSQASACPAHCRAEACPTDPNGTATQSPTAPSQGPTVSPTTSTPTTAPSASPTGLPTFSPTSIPTALPSSLPTFSPSGTPTTTPTSIPSIAPTIGCNGVGDAPTCNTIANAVSCADPALGVVCPATCRLVGFPQYCPNVTFVCNGVLDNPAICENVTADDCDGILGGLCPGHCPQRCPSTNLPTTSPTARPTPTPTTTPTSSPTSGPTTAPSGSPTELPTTSPTFSCNGAPDPPNCILVDCSVAAFQSLCPGTCGTCVSITLSPGVASCSPVSDPPSCAQLFPQGVNGAENSLCAVPESAGLAALCPGHCAAFCTSSPTIAPTASPTSTPTAAPTRSPVQRPTSSPSEVPTATPTDSLPTLAPTLPPTFGCNGIADPAGCEFVLDCTEDIGRFCPGHCPLHCIATLPPSSTPLVCNGESDSPSCASFFPFDQANQTESPNCINPDFASLAALCRGHCQSLCTPSDAPTSEPSARPSVTPTLTPTAPTSRAPTQNPTNQPSLSPSAAPSRSCGGVADPEECSSQVVNCSNAQFQQLCPATCQACPPTPPTSNEFICNGVVDDSSCDVLFPTDVNGNEHANCTTSSLATACPGHCRTLHCTTTPTTAPTGLPSVPPSSSSPTTAPTLGCFGVADPEGCSIVNCTELLFRLACPGACGACGSAPTPATRLVTCNNVVDSTSCVSVFPVNGDGSDNANCIDPTFTPLAVNCPGHCRAFCTLPPSLTPTSQPTHHPTASPTAHPTLNPTARPTAVPTSQPTRSCNGVADPPDCDVSLCTVPEFLPRCPATCDACPTTTPPVQRFECNGIADDSSCNTLFPPNLDGSEASACSTSQLAAQCPGHCSALCTPSPTAVPTVSPSFEPSAVPSFAPTTNPTNGCLGVPDPVGCEEIDCLDPVFSQLCPGRCGRCTFPPTSTRLFNCNGVSDSPSCDTLFSLNPVDNSESSNCSDPLLSPLAAQCPGHCASFCTVAPSHPPTSFPTSDPTASPTSHPTNSPTAHPTASPSIVPTLTPTRGCFGIADPEGCEFIDCEDVALRSTCPGTCGVCSQPPSPARSFSCLGVADSASCSRLFPVNPADGLDNTNCSTSSLVSLARLCPGHCSVFCTPSPTTSPTSFPTELPTSRPTGSPADLITPTAAPSLAPTFGCNGVSDPPGCNDLAADCSTPSITTLCPGTCGVCVPTPPPVTQFVCNGVSDPASCDDLFPPNADSSESVACDTNPLAIACPGHCSVIFCTPEPTTAPSAGPTSAPTLNPTNAPTLSPTVSPTESPTTSSPTISPTLSPTLSPSISPSVSPSTSPTLSPSFGCFGIQDPGGCDLVDCTQAIFRNLCPGKCGNCSPPPSPVRTFLCQGVLDLGDCATLFPPNNDLSDSDNCAQPEFVLLAAECPGHCTSFCTTPPSEAPTTHAPTAAPTGSPTITPSASPTLHPTSHPTNTPSLNPTSVPTSSPTASCNGRSDPAGCNLVDCQDLRFQVQCPGTCLTCTPPPSPVRDFSCFGAIDAPSCTTIFPVNLDSTDSGRCSDVDFLLLAAQCPGHCRAFCTVPPSAVPTAIPSRAPSSHPTLNPTSQPTAQPTSIPTTTPSSNPTATPTRVPSQSPTSSCNGVSDPRFCNLINCAEEELQSLCPGTCGTCTSPPSPARITSCFGRADVPSCATVFPTQGNGAENVACTDPSFAVLAATCPGHCSSFCTASPTAQPTKSPSNSPSAVPTAIPTSRPSEQPTASPSSTPSLSPSSAPTVVPSAAPTFSCRGVSDPPGCNLVDCAETTFQVLCPGTCGTCTTAPTQARSLSCFGVNDPTSCVGLFPVNSDGSDNALCANPQFSILAATCPGHCRALCTSSPTTTPTTPPTASPSNDPTQSPTNIPTVAPSQLPSSSPTLQPSLAPTELPTTLPTAVPTASPTIDCSVAEPVECAIAADCNESVFFTLCPQTCGVCPTFSPTAPNSGLSCNGIFDPLRCRDIFPRVNGSDNPACSSPLAAACPAHCRARFCTTSPTTVPTSTPPTAVPSQTPTRAPTRLPTSSPSKTPTGQPTHLPTTAPPTHGCNGVADPPECAGIVPSQCGIFQPGLGFVGETCPGFCGLVDPTFCVPATAAPTPAPVPFACAGVVDQPSCAGVDCSTVLARFCPGHCPLLCTDAPSAAPTPLLTNFLCANAPNGPAMDSSICIDLVTRGDLVKPCPTEFVVSCPGYCEHPGCGTFGPTMPPTVSPSSGSPTQHPSATPTNGPTALPTTTPTEIPSAAPTERPSASPTRDPTATPTHVPTISPSTSPTDEPTPVPTSPTASPTLPACNGVPDPALCATIVGDSTNLASVCTPVVQTFCPGHCTACSQPTLAPTAPTGAPTASAGVILIVDGVEQFFPCADVNCSNDCTGACGWSRNQGACIVGGRTSGSEANLGVCPIVTEAPSTAAPTAVAPCSSILCSNNCGGNCGWSSNKNRCVEGGRTTSSEVNLGQCDSVTAAPTAATSVTCGTILCARDCVGSCGWSRNKNACLLGGRTTNSELGLGQCS